MLSHWLYNTEHDRAVCHIRHRGLDRTDRRVKVVFVPCYLNGLDGILDQSYYDLLVGMDLTIYPSYYEPWGLYAAGECALWRAYDHDDAGGLRPVG